MNGTKSKSTLDRMQDEIGNVSISQQDKKMSGEYRTEIPNEIIEEQTKKIPNLFFLVGALASIAGSAVLIGNNKKLLGNFVGLWVPTLLSLGIYNKLVKLEDEILRLNK